MSADLATLRAGGTVTLGPGVYRAARPIVIEGAAGFTLLGRGATILGVVEFIKCRDFRIEGLTFDGGRVDGPAADGTLINRARGDGHVPTLRLYSCSEFTLDDCTFLKARGDHLYIASNTFAGRVIGCTFKDAWRNGIAIINAHDLRFEGNAIDTVHGEILGAGIDIEGNAEDPEGCNHDITIMGNTFRDCAESGVRITNGREPYRIDVLNNAFERIPTGVLVGGRDCRVIGNVFRDSQRPEGAAGENVRAQVYLNGTHVGGLTEVSGNRFQRLNGLGAVNSHVTWTGTVVIADNAIEGVKGERINAINVYSNGAIVRDNIIHDVESGSGIAIFGQDAMVIGNVLRGGGDRGPGAIWSRSDGGWYSENRVSDWSPEVVLPAGNGLK